jgi:radical SAM superfamily enzyme YgiQ (UPF0313 family)
MRILFCNPKNSQGLTHSRKGMYAPLGILSISTVLKEKLGNRIDITVYDEDVEDVDLSSFNKFDLIGFYTTTFNYPTCIEYASAAKDNDALTLLGGPHSTVLADNIMRNQNCFDFLVRFEAEFPISSLVECILNNDKSGFKDIPNLIYKANGKVFSNQQFYENDLKDLPIPSRDFVHFDLYIDNFKKLYPDKSSIRPGSIYSSKGCSWRDKTGGCVFCARLEEGVKFRDIRQIWNEIRLLRDKYNINSIWDISDDNLNNKEWFKHFVKNRPDDCRDLTFFIYSRVNFIREDMIEYLVDLNVKEVFLGVESGDNALLKSSFKGQTVNTILRCVNVLKNNNIKYFPSFILGLPGESEASMANTNRLCQDLADLGGLDRLGCTILQPIPGSRAYDMILQESDFGKKLALLDNIDLKYLEKYWIDNFTNVEYKTIVEFQNKINETMNGYLVFGDSNNKE